MSLYAKKTNATTVTVKRKFLEITVVINATAIIVTITKTMSISVVRNGYLRLKPLISISVSSFVSLLILLSVFPYSFWYSSTDFALL